MLSLYEYNQVEKKPIKIKLHGRNLTLTKADYIISDVDLSLIHI